MLDSGKAIDTDLDGIGDELARQRRGILRSLGGASNAAQQFSQSLAEVAQQQNATLQSDTQPLPANRSLETAGEVSKTTQSRGQRAASDDPIKTVQCDTGTAVAWSEPRLQASAPCGITQLTSANHFLVSGANTVLVAEHDNHLVSQGRYALSGKDGLVLFIRIRRITPRSPIRRPAFICTQRACHFIDRGDPGGSELVGHYRILNICAGTLAAGDQTNASRAGMWCSRV